MQFFMPTVNILSIIFIGFIFFISVQSLSRVWLFAAPCTTAHQASLPISNSWSLLKLMSIESVMPSIYFLYRSNLVCQYPLLSLYFQFFPVFSSYYLFISSFFFLISDLAMNSSLLANILWSFRHLLLTKLLEVKWISFCGSCFLS